MDNQQTQYYSAPSYPQAAHLGPGNTRLPWIFIVAGGATAVFAFALLFFVATIYGIEEISRFFSCLVFKCEALAYLCSMLAVGGCVVAGLGYVFLKKYYDAQGNAIAASSLGKLSLYSFIQAGLIFMIMAFLIVLDSYHSFYWSKSWGVYLFFLASFAVVFGLTHFLIKKEWMGLVENLNWDEKFNIFLKLGYTLAFWSITVAASFVLIFSISLLGKVSDGFFNFVSSVGALAYWGALTGGVFWVMAQVKLMLHFGNVFSANQPKPQQYQQPQQPIQQPQQPIQQQPYQQPQQPIQQQYQQPYQQPQQPQQFPPQQPYQQPQQPIQQPYQQPQQPQQFQQQQSQQPQQPQQQQDYNEQLRQQQYEEYRRQQQQRMREQGEDSNETLPYTK